MIPTASIRIELTNGQRYPAIMFHFKLDDDGHGYHGHSAIWENGNEKTNCEHTLSIRQGSPLGSLHVTLDCITYGAWATAQMPGVEITERDLYWAALWAVQAIKHRHTVAPCVKEDSVSTAEIPATMLTKELGEFLTPQQIAKVLEAMEVICSTCWDEDRRGATCFRDE